MLSVQIWSRTRAGEQQGDDWSRRREREEQEPAAVRIRSRTGERRAGEREQGERGESRATTGPEEQEERGAGAGRRQDPEGVPARVRRDQGAARSGGSEDDGGRGGRDLALVQPERWRNGGTVARLQEVAEHVNTARGGAFSLVPALRRQLVTHP